MKVKKIYALFFIISVISSLNCFAQKTQSDNGDGTYTNPVIAADFPDPDVICVNDTYYMVTTTMFVFPGVTVLKSKDLVNWEYCSNAVPRFDFSKCYNLDGCKRYGHGQWATSLKYNNGKFFSANLNKASLENEYNAVILETDCIDTDDLNKKNLAFVQIAGFVARRIVCKINKGEKVIAGNRFGLIKYGSRMDLYLPLDFTTYVKVNDKVYAGKTIIGKII